ncbi:MAG: hypothetical protein AAB622_00175 [Patescibacteria group bacterium]
MSLRSITTGISDVKDSLYIPYPIKPNVIQVGKFRVPEYVTPEETKKCVDRLIDQIDIAKFDHALVNLQGGAWLFNEYSKRAGPIGIPVHMIQINRPDGGFGATEVIPVPKKCWGKACIIFEDIYDTGGVIDYIMGNLDPESLTAVVVDKQVEKMPLKYKILAAMKIEKKWIMGCGMDGGVKGEGRTFRDWAGIVVNPNADH